MCNTWRALSTTLFKSIKMSLILSDEKVVGHLSHSHSLELSKGSTGVRLPLQKFFTYKINRIKLILISVCFILIKLNFNIIILYIYNRFIINFTIYNSFSNLS